MAPKLLDSYDMLFPTAQSLVEASIPNALPIGFVADKHESLVAQAKIFETFQLNWRLFYCNPVEVSRMGKMDGLVVAHPAEEVIRIVLEEQKKDRSCN